MQFKKVLLSILGGGVLAFGLYNVHSISGVTEGGALGLTLLLNHWLSISPAWSGLVINFACYAFGFRTLGAAFLGAVFVGIGVGLCVRAGGAPTGDDALAMSLSRRFRVRIERVYLLTDLTVLALSLSYLPLKGIACSVLTVTLSSKLIGIIQRYNA